MGRSTSRISRTRKYLLFRPAARSSGALAGRAADLESSEPCIVSLRRRTAACSPSTAMLRRSRSSMLAGTTFAQRVCHFSSARLIRLFHSRVASLLLRAEHTGVDMQPIVRFICSTTPYATFDPLHQFLDRVNPGFWISGAWAVSPERAMAFCSTRDVYRTKYIGTRRTARGDGWLLPILKGARFLTT